MQNQVVSTKQLREDFSSVLELLALGQDVTLTYRNRKIAKIKPFKRRKRSVSGEEAAAKIRKLAGGYRLTRHLSPDELNKDYDKMYDEMLP